MKVLKFGGTSVSSAQTIKNIIEIILDNDKNEVQLIIVSAFATITNLLQDTARLASVKNLTYTSNLTIIKDIHLKLIAELIPIEEQQQSIDFVEKKIKELNLLLNSIKLINELSPKSEAKVLSFGELLSARIITNILNLNLIDAIYVDSRELISTNANYTNAIVDFDKTNKQIKSFLKTNNSIVIVLPGYIASSSNGDTTVLGRGGSDYSAAIFAAAIDASFLEIWTDVSGMYTAHPNLVSQAIPIEQISYEEAMELSHFGAKVIYPPTIHPILKKKIPILIKNTLHPLEKGTLITEKSNQLTYPVKGITHIDDIALITLEGSGMVGIPGFSKRLFEVLATEKINVKLITQSSSEHSICIGIDSYNSERAKIAIDAVFELEILRDKINPLLVENHLSIIAVVGDHMKNHQGISGKMFSTLGKNNVNIRAIAQGASEKNISAIILSKDVKKALNCLHESFFKDNYKQLNLFITGVGNVGEKLIDQIKLQHQFLLDNLKIKLRIIGISNSKKMIFNEDGISLNTWKEDLYHGENASTKSFFDKTLSLNLRNSIFIDITASQKIAEVYKKYLKNSIAVVACNKIACSSDYSIYSELKDLSIKYNTPFLFETNVGAGLPIIATLNNLVMSGDKIIKIQAVLSGSLNFIFNNFNTHNEFYDIVKQAQDEGYTEPDPRIDLSGVDVARKILILARECGVKLDLQNIENVSFLTLKNQKADTVNDFYNSLISEASHFKNLLASAENNNCQLKYVAEFSDGKAKVALKEIPEGHPFYNLKGKDNIVMFYTNRYSDQPMIIKGAGAGADVTASGLFADIIKIASN